MSRQTLRLLRLQGEKTKRKKKPSQPPEMPRLPPRRSSIFALCTQRDTPNDWRKRLKNRSVCGESAKKRRVRLLARRGSSSSASSALTASDCGEMRPSQRDLLLAQKLQREEEEKQQMISAALAERMRQLEDPGGDSSTAHPGLDNSSLQNGEDE